jgi:hypothetical protein
MVPFKEIEVHITAMSGKTRVIGTTAVPRSVRYAGHVGVGLFSDGYGWSDPPYSIFEAAIKSEEGSLFLPAGNNYIIFANSIYWRLAPGVTATIIGWW